MSVVTSIAIILLTAMASSVCTLLLAGWLYQRRLSHALDALIEEKTAEIGDQLEARVREGVRQGIEDGVAEQLEGVAAELEARVSDGVQNGMDEGLAEMRRDVLKKAARGATETSVGLIEESLDLMFGTSRRRRERDDD